MPCRNVRSKLFNPVNPAPAQPTPESPESQLLATAREAGFSLAGIATASPPKGAGAFRRWLQEGRHADMAWLERTADKRCDPALVLPGVRAVVLLGMNYWQGPRAASATTAATGKVARYAWGSDYHDYLLTRMRPLLDLLESWGGENRAYVDTGPVLERDLAQRAGLGWQGKSTMLIHRRAGTWFFLGEILTTLPLQPTPPETDHCGSCTRCMVACPTGAIGPAYQLDARKCLSYWTIENKGPIPENYRTALADRIYGCDDCLEACPWNRFATTAAAAIWQARRWAEGSLEEIPLRAFLGWDEAAFRERFRGSPIRRIKQRGFLRNVCVALGNTGSQEDLPALEKATHGDPLVAEHATWAIGKITHRSRPPSS